MHQFKATQDIAISLDECWDFFSDPRNLQKITPPEMDFQILTELPTKAYPGLFIAYTVKPFGFGKVEWVTEITQVQEKAYFVDEQRKGPYTIWHHEHWFEEMENGQVRMRDLVSYTLPLGFLGRIMEPFLVRPKLEAIFRYRKQKIEEIFGN